MTAQELSPRARAILAAVEREIDARRHTAPAPAPASVAIDPALLTALELAVAGLSRDEVRARVAIADHALDAVFGGASPPQARLTRRT